MSPILLTGVGSGLSNIARLAANQLLDEGESVKVFIHRDDGRAAALQDRGAEVVVGDLSNPAQVRDALNGVSRCFFNTSVSETYLEEIAVMCSLIEELTDFEVLVNMSQMIVSQMTSTSSEESEQQRLHWLAERVVTWSGVPAVEVRATVFLDNPIFRTMPRESVATRHVIPLPIGIGKTSPVAATDVARVVSTVLRSPSEYLGRALELTGPEALDLHEIGDRFGRALGERIVGEDIPLATFELEVRSAHKLSGQDADHIITLARLHRENRYSRVTSEVEAVTGRRAESIESYVASHRQLFVGASAPKAS